jgi:starch phosphorylase
MRTSGVRDFFTAHQRVAESVAFTTHTPVSAGHDSFAAALVEAYLAEYREQLGLSHEEFMALGRRDRNDNAEEFSMTVLALRSAHARNAVSQLHGMVSRKLWSGIGVGTQNVKPRIEMEAITNGVHTGTWTGPEMGALFDRYIGSSWRAVPQQPSVWAQIATADLHALWVARSAQRARLLERVDTSARGQGIPGLGPSITRDRALVIGFARRFATYKRAGLLLRDPTRLARLLDDPTQPLVLVFAGKAHPHDEPAKFLIQQIVEASRDVRFSGRLMFFVDYDVDLARLLVQGSDIWLNTPRRPQEASGTSGMKATLNGALHVSELDGWWDEAYAPGLGWALGDGLADDLFDEARDRAEASQLMDLLENEIVPLYFRRDDAGRPVEWLRRVQHSIEMLAGAFSAHRMVDEYVERVYAPLAQRRANRMTCLENGCQDAVAAA